MSSHQRSRVLFFGGGGGNACVLLADESKLDADNPYTSSFKTNALVPATPTAEVICYATYIVVTATNTSADLSLVVRLYVDSGTAAAVRNIVVPATSGERTRRFEVSWHTSVSGGGPEQVTVAPRGFMLQVEVETAGVIPAGRFSFDGIECDAELLMESIGNVAT